MLGLVKRGFCSDAYTSSFVNKRAKSGEVNRYYYYKPRRRADAAACPGADSKANMIDDALIDYFRQLARKPEKL